MIPKDRLKSLMDKVEIVPESGCWIWTGSLQGKGWKKGQGYSAIRFNNKLYRGHRLFYEHFKGPIPEGRQLDHLCRVTCCVNPNHLEPVTNAVNRARGIGNKGEHHLSKTHCPNGHEYTLENTRYSVSKGRKHRVCHQCRLETYRKYEKEKRVRKC